MGSVLSCLSLQLCECAACCACSLLSKAFNATLRQAARCGHLLIIVLVYVLAITLGQRYPDEINNYVTTLNQNSEYTNLYNINLSNDCDINNINECIYRQLIYRASFALFILYASLMILVYFSDYINKSLWTLKIIIPVGIFIGFWFIDNSYVNNFAEFSRVMSFFWLLIQGFLLFDFAHDSHDIIITASDREELAGGDSRYWKSIYLLLSVCFLLCAFVGFGYLCSGYSECPLGKFFVAFTFIAGVFTTFISATDAVKGGLLTPCIMFAYSVFICWYALLSNPDSSCNPYASMNDNPIKNSSIIIVVIISFITLTYCVVNGTVILNVFNPEGEGVMNSQFNNKAESSLNTTNVNNSDINSSSSNSDEGNLISENNTAAAAALSESSGTVHERVFFHFLCMWVSCYGAMVLTNWGKTNGAPEGTGSDVTGNESMWFKILSQWIFIIIYLAALYVKYRNNAIE